MAQLLETWLNSEVELSKKVTNFEEDFSNGYLLGELLYKFNQQPDFDCFKDRHTRNYVLSNFTHMIDVFKSLGVKFDTNIINGIIKKENGAAIKLLYQLKMALEKTSPPTDVTLLKKGKLNEQPPVKSIRPERPQFDEMEKKNTVTRLQKMNRAQKEVDLDKKMDRFAQFQIKSEKRAQQDKINEAAREIKLKDEKRKALINKLQRNAGFMEDWEQKGVQDWNYNMEIKKNRENMELTYKLKQFQHAKDVADTMYTKEVNEEINGINEFEAKTMKEHGISTKPYKATQTMAQTVSYFRGSTPATITTQERDIKRRTMAARLNQLEVSEEVNYRQDLALKKLDILSNIEEDIANEIWKVTHYTELMVAHRKLRETRYERRREYDSEIAQLKERKMLERWIDNMWIEVELEEARAHRLEIDLQVEQRNEKGKDMENMIELLLGITEEVYAFQQNKNSEELDKRYWNEWVHLFKDGSNVIVGNNEALNIRELDDYILGKGQWNYNISVFNYKFSDALLKLIDWKFDSEVDNKGSLLPCPPIKLAMIGYPYSGKSTHAGRLRTRYNIDIIEVKDIIAKASIDILLEGKTLRDEDIVNLIVEKIMISNEAGWILVDFPTNSSQAKLLEEALTNFKDPIEKEKSQKEINIEKVLKIAPLECKPPENKDLYKSGLDYLIWLWADKRECLRRSFGRRIDPKTNLLYHIEDDVPTLNESPLVENLQPDDKINEHRGAIVDRMIALDRHTHELTEWLWQFGKDQKSILVNIDTNKPIMESGVEIEELVEELIQKRRELDEKLQREEEERKKQEDAVALEAQEALDRKRESAEMLKEDQRETALFEEPYQDKTFPVVQEKPDGLWEFWEVMQDIYVAALLQVFELERYQRTDSTQHLKQIQEEFLEFLYRPCEKQDLLNKFQMDFNQFSDENPDMREDQATIAELHQRTEDLCNQIWDIIEKRQLEAEEELKDIKNCGWLEGQSDLIMRQVQAILQSEYQRYGASIQVLTDYYATLEKRKLPKCEIPQIDLVLEGLNPSETIDKLCDRIAQTPPYVPAAEEEKEVKDPKAKKPAPKGKKEEEKIEKTEIQLEMEATIKKEHEILLYRVDRAKNWGKSRIKELEQETTKIYQRMEKWIYSAILAENKAVDEISNIIRNSIEKQIKIQPLLELKTLDAIIHENIITFETVPPPIIPPKEPISPTKISMPQLRSIVEEFLQYPLLINVNVLANIIFRRKKLSALLDNVDSLPEKWRLRSYGEIIGLVNTYDNEQRGFLKWTSFLSYLMQEAQNSQIEEISQLIKQKASNDILEAWEKELTSKKQLS
ncbi:unnamed protein product [Blepharisma stoltei]|uniref:Calponin-homology (CH) domain-containing protein n=1 Tax=Blepharisma stoltei TaxID=1481888 RepID=A0AAU9I4U9_9CILI|nr:unnamed protein product [Blepharisma stoltei]